MIKCVFCKSSQDIVLAGKHYNKKGETQRYKCNICKRRFVPNDAFWKMKNSPEIVAEALNCKKRGMSYEEVSKHFQEYDKADISGVTVFNWVKKYGNTFDDFSKKQIPKLSGKINANEFVFKVKKNKGATALFNLGDIYYNFIDKQRLMHEKTWRTPAQRAEIS